MLIIENLNFKNKLFILLLVPILVILFFSSTAIYNKVNTSSEMNKIDQLIILSTHISSLVHELQKERGTTAVFMGSKGRRFSTEMKAQRVETDSKKLSLDNFLLTFDHSYIEGSHLDNAVKKLSKLSANRSQASSLQVAAKQVIGFYTQLNEKFINSINYIAKVSPDVEIGVLSTAYTSFLQAKERAGIERAVLSNVIASDSFSGIEKAISLKAQQNTYFKNFNSYATEQQSQLYKNLTHSSASVEINRMRNIVYAAATNRQRQSIIFKLITNAGYGSAIHQFKNYILRQQPKYLQDFNSNYQTIQQLIYQYQSIPSVKANELSLLASIKDIFDTYRSATLKASALIKQGASSSTIDKAVRIDDSLAISALDKLILINEKANIGLDAKTWFDTATTRINGLKQIEDQISADLKALATEKQQLASASLLWISIITAISLALTFILAYFITQSLLKQLGGEPIHVIATATKVSQGNLSDHDNDSKTVKTGLMAHMHEMTTNLKNIVTTVKGVSTQISSRSAFLVSEAEKMIEAGNTQSNNVTSIATAACQLTETINEIAQTTSSIANTASDAVDHANKGVAIVEKTKTEVEGIHNTVSQTSDLVKSLGEKSTQIGQFVDVINNIAEQTNLLALNAAIEAARAGEHGRGFAVVADEVRSLAVNTTKSTNDIEMMVREIQTETQTAIRSMEESLQRVESGVLLSANAGNSLSHILESISNLQGMVHSTAGATEELSNVSNNILNDIQGVAQHALDSINIFKEVSKASGNLEDSSSNLIDSMAYFKV